MATPKKKKAPKKRGKYEDKTPVSGSFLDIIKASVKHADKNSRPKE